MKKLIVTTKLFALSLATVLATASVSIANDKAEKPVELKYINTTTELPIYQLRLNNSSKGVYVVSIKDATGVLLYNETVNGTNIVRNYQMDEPLPEGIDLVFEVSNVKAKTTKVYNVTKKVKLVEDVVVNEVK